MLSFKGDQREFLAEGARMLFWKCDRDPWTKGQFLEMSQELENTSTVANCDGPIMLQTPLQVLFL